MQAVILAAGEGTRMYPLTHSTPKPLLTVGDCPLVAHVADAAVDAGASGLVFVVAAERGPVREQFGNHHRGVPVQYAVQDPPEGTADAVEAAVPALDGAFAVLNGDNLYDAASLGELFDAGPSVGVHRVENPTEYGVVERRDERVVRVVEKPQDPPSELANAGAYVFPAATRDWFSVPRSERGERELTDVLTRVVDAYDVTPVEVDRWIDVGRPWELLAANELVIPEYDHRIEGEVHEDADLSDQTVVEEGATVRAGTTVDGAVLIRSGATVGPNARVRGTTLVERGATVGHAVEVKNSILLEDSSAAHLSYVGDSIVGEGVNVGAGTTVANLRHDEAPVELTVKGERVSTGRRKFGAVLGPAVKTGVNTSINPGVTLAPGATTGAGEVVDRDR